MGNECKMNEELTGGQAAGDSGSGGSESSVAGSAVRAGTYAQAVCPARMVTIPGQGRLTVQDIQYLADEAIREIPPRVAFYAEKAGVRYRRITIRNQRSRWGSCSSRGNLNFNCLLMLMPVEVMDSVIVHELCHLKEMNHSRRFYAEVVRVYPEYWKWDRWLKDNGSAIMRRMTG